MYMPCTVCVQLLMVSVLARPQIYTNIEEDLVRERTMRSLLSPIVKLLRSTKLIHTTKHFKLYKKVGNAEQAEKDFRALKLAHYQNVGYARSGEIGNMQVTLMYPDRFPRLIIQSYKNNADGTSEIIRREIVYTVRRDAVLFLKDFKAME